LSTFAATAVPALAHAQPTPSAQSKTGDVNVAVGYLFVTANAKSLSNPELIGALPRGIELAVAGRVSRIASLVADCSISRSGAVVIPTGGLTGLNNPSVKGTVTFGITDLMGGVKFSSLEPGGFVQVLAGLSLGSREFTDVLSAGQTGVALDQGMHAALAIRPEVGLEWRSGTVGVRAQVGAELALSSSSVNSHATGRVRAALLLTFGR